MVRASLTLLALLAGAVPLAAQEPLLWRDPDQGCVYLVTPQGGIGLRYRRDGSPDCPERPSAGRVPSTLPSPPTVSRAVPAAPVAWPAAPRPEAPRTRATAAWTDDPQIAAPRGRDGAVAVGLTLSFGCWPIGENPRGNAAAVVRVRVEPQTKLILVDAGGRDAMRYTLDSDGDLWFNGRNERDPRLGIILSPSRGHMWLDVSARATPRAEVTSQPFECRPEGTVY